MNQFVYSYPVKVYFGNDVMESALREELAKVGSKVMLAYGGGSLKRTGLYDRLHALLVEMGKSVVDFGGIMPNPTYAKVQEGAKLAREEKIDFILAVGGGSVIDCCKIISCQAVMDEDIWELEYTKKGKPGAGLPIGAVVTASGTGAEMNNGAVITNEEKKEKSPLWGSFHSFAVLDPQLTMTLPAKQVISGAFDTLSHAMETYMGTPREVNLSDEIGEAVMRNVIRNLRVLVSDINNVDARSELMWASAMAENGILKLGKVTDFQCHMIEHQLGAYTDCNHGQGLAVIHPALYRHLLPSNTKQFTRLATAVWGVDAEGKTEELVGAEGIAALEAFIKEIGMPSKLSEMGIAGDGVDDILRKVADTCFLTAGCAKKLDRDEIYELLQEVK